MTNIKQGDTVRIKGAPDTDQPRTVAEVSVHLSPARGAPPATLVRLTPGNEWIDAELVEVVS